MTVAPLFTDHLFLPLGMMVKQVALARTQLVQKPIAQASTCRGPCCRIRREARRVDFYRRGVKIILNLVPPGVEAVCAAGRGDRCGFDDGRCGGVGGDHCGSGQWGKTASERTEMMSKQPISHSMER